MGIKFTDKDTGEVLLDVQGDKDSFETGLVVGTVSALAALKSLEEAGKITKEDALKAMETYQEYALAVSEKLDAA